MRGGRERGEAAPGIDRVSRGSQGEESGTEHDDGFACGDLARVVRRLRGGRSTTPALGSWSSLVVTRSLQRDTVQHIRRPCSRSK
jgi:hypothetical protein